jgi:paraquat-inducible protein B
LTTDRPSGDEGTNARPDTAGDRQFPVAEVRRRVTLLELVSGSRLWWVTLACLLVAVVLAWRASGDTGPTITIHFPDGHGLRVGDMLRHRGIEVGLVENVDLNPELSGVDVAVTLRPGAEVLARTDTQFWIVRPRLSLEGISGLETAVGAKYIAARSGAPDSTTCYEFEGLATAPADELGEDGVEVILRGTDSHGLSPGAPVLWRGVTVGEILAVNLASDTRYIDIRARIDATYRRLVRPNSRFWMASGLGVDAGLTGISFKAESLTTIARGGISFITPNEGARTKPVEAGHVFQLHEEPEGEWLDAASTVSLIDFELPPTVNIRTSWQQRSIALTRNHDRSVGGLLLAVDSSAVGGVRLIGPVDGMTRPDAALENSWRLDVLSPGTGDPIFTLPEGAELAALPSGVCSCALRVEGPIADAVLPGRTRVPTVPEDCLLVRSVGSAGDRSSLVHSISRMQIIVAETNWRITGIDQSMSDWHGAAVVSATDGAAIGMFLVSRSGPIVAPFGADLIE